MGLLDSIKGAYFSLEDKYYSLMDSIDEHVPVYKLIDPIDKIIPSFIVFCIIILLLLCGIGFFLYLNFFATAKFSAIVSDETGTLIPDANVTLIFGSQSKTITTNQYGKTPITDFAMGEIEIKVTAENYTDYTEEKVKLQKENLDYKITMTPKAGAGIDRKIRLVNRAGQPIYELVSLSFACNNKTATAPEDTTTTNGEITIKEPLTCNGLTVTVRSAKYDSIESKVLLQDTETISLEDKIVGKGTIKVNLSFNDNPVQESILVYLYTAESVGPIDQKISQNGTVTFEDAEAGTYTITTKATQKFSSARKENLELEANDDRTVSIELEQNVVGTIKIKVVDRDTNKAIDNVHVTLKKDTEQVAEQTTSIDENAMLEFPVSENTQYTAIADHDDYCLGTLTGLTISQGLTLFKIRKFTGDCGGSLKVKVIDQDALPIRNAIVSLGNEQHYFIGVKEKTSDVNGMVIFNGLPSGTYSAFAFKATNSGWSDAKYFNRRGSAANDPDLVVTVQSPDGTVQVKAIDREDKPIPFASIYFIDVITGQPIGGGAIPADANGIAEITTRADKEVYTIVESPDYASYKSPGYSVLANSTQLIVAKLLPKQDKFEVELLGLFSNNLAATTLVSGTEYQARFRIKIPDSMKTTATEIGLHVRVGTEQIVEKDLLFIKETNAPNASIVKGTAFTGNYSTDIASISSSDAKWANLTWNKVEASINDVELTIKIKETAGLGKKLDIQYRAWEKNGATKRDPPSENTTADDMYANTKVATFQTGSGTLCTDKFCFDATITDKDQALSASVTESYAARIFNKYTLAFTISNSGKYDTDTIKSAELRIKNLEGNLLLTKYSISDASSKLIEGTANSAELPRLNVGNISPTRKTSGTIEFIPQLSMDGTIHFELVDTDMGIIAFTKDLRIAVTSENDLSVTVTPTILPSGTENEITVKVKDKATSLELDKAIVRIKDRFGTEITRKETNKLGNAVLVLPAQAPGEKLTLLVEKPNYNLSETVLTVNTDVIELTPDQVGLALSPKGTFSAEKQIKIKNIAAFPITLTKLEFTTKQKKFLDFDTMNGSLKIFEGTEIKKDNDTTIVFKGMLSDAGKNIKERTEISGTLGIEYSAYSQTWRKEIPIRITIGVGGETSDPNCLTITKKEWKAATEGKPLILELQIENNCVIENTPIALQNLEAKVDWQSNKLGDFELMTENSATLLRAGYFKTIANVVEKEQTINAQITFTPSSGVNGVAKAKIVIQAENPTESKAQTIGTELTTEITTLNLIDCVSFTKEDMEMTQASTTTGATAQTAAATAQDSFTIKTAQCGAPVQFKLESDLDLSTKEFTMKADDSKEIKVRGEGFLPGQYGIKVNVEGASAKTSKQIKNLSVLVYPSADSCIRLSRYEFNIYDNPSNPYDGADSVKLYNECIDTTVNVQVDTHSWLNAMKQGLIWAGVGLAGGLLAMWGQKTMGGNSNQTGKVILPLSDSVSMTGRITMTGLADAPASGAGGFGAMGGIGSMMGGLGNLANLLTSNPLLLALAGFAAGTLYAYSNQETLDIPVVAPDVQLKNVTGTYMDKAATALDPAIKATVNEKETIEPKKSTGASQLNVSVKTITFANTTGITQPDALNPLYRYLKADGIRNVYAAKQTYKDEEGDPPSPSKLNKEAPKDVLQLFHLQFDSYKPCSDGNCMQPSTELRNCQLGNKIGSTGENALPKIKFSWSWKDIGLRECDDGNPNYIYCDATQFSIELLKKMELLKEFIELNAPFECPSIVSEIAPVTQPLSGTDLDYGITRLDIEKLQQDINVVATIESNNNLNVNVETTFTLTNQATGAVTNCVKTADLLSKTIVGCDFKNLTPGAYEAKAIITNTSGCTKCINSSILNDKATKQFTMGLDRTLVECEPFATMEGSTNRLEKFIIASQDAGRSLQYPAGIAGAAEMASLVKFKAHLIKDGYSTDFRKDFDDFAKTRDFFNTEQYYTDPKTGLSKYFMNEKAMEFDYFGAPIGPIRDPGVYDIGIDINFTDKTMKFFNNDEPNAKIIIHMEKTKDAKPASPFYYLPFNGNIGEETGRIGYGLNYLLKTPDKTVKINNDILQPVRIRDLPGSNPVMLLNGAYGDDFRTLNQTSRGIVLDVDLARELLTISPSKATPIIMEIDSQTSEDAYGYYAVEIDKEPQATSAYLTKWLGVGMTCTDFAGNSMENYKENPDMHGIDSKCARLGMQDLTSYGLEWCNKKFSGKVFLQGIFFTPQAKVSLLYRVAAAESMSLIGMNSSGAERVELNGISTLKAINTVQDVFDLVQEEKVCLVGYDNQSQTQFFWNPKFILDQLAPQRTQAESQCTSNGT